MVPKGWKLTTLGQVCDGNLQTGPFGSQLHAHEYVDTGIPVLMPKDLVNCRANLSNAAKITSLRAKDLKKHILKSGDLLFSRRGDVTRFALIDEDSEGSICGTGCLKARPSNKHSSSFLAYFLQKDSVKKWLEQNAVGQTMPNMNTEILNELPLMSASSKEEEEKIAQILSTWDQAISVTEKLLENSQQQKKALMQQLLTGKKRLLDENGVRFSGDWGKIKLGNLIVQHSEKTEINDQYPVLTSSRKGLFFQKDYYNGRDIASDDTTGYNVVPYGYFTYRHMSDDLVFSFNINNLCEKGIVSTLYPVFKAREELVIPELLRLILNEGLAFKKFSLEQKQGGSRTYMYLSKLKELKLTIPPMEEQKEIIEILSIAQGKVENLQKKLDCLKQEKKALMQQLLTGKKRVKVAA